MYDIVGDIHGHADALKSLLHKMDYRQESGVWKHPERKVIFLGDYIDRGPAIRETLHIVRSMKESGHALAIMGNHEFNALAWAYVTEGGGHLRKHSEKNFKQHHETLSQFEQHKEEWQDHLQWFYSLPLFLELDGFRAVHACWDDVHIQWLKNNNGPLLTLELLAAAHVKKSVEKSVIDDILKGKEIDIPEKFVWSDKDGNIRKENRIKWWVQPNANTRFRDYIFNCPPELEGHQVTISPDIFIYPSTAPPVFVGHYWLNGSEPEIMGANVACLDYSVAKKGFLVAYRWDGERILKKEKMVF